MDDVTDVEVEEELLIGQGRGLVDLEVHLVLLQLDQRRSLSKVS